MTITNEELKTAVGAEYRSLRAIGEDLGLSSERVRQLLKKRGITRASRVYAYPICTICNLPNYKIRGKYRQKYRRHQECQSVTLTCPEPCSKVFTVLRSDARLHRERKTATNVWFFSKSCWNKWRWLDHRSEANARLIAAAPEMLALLKRYDELSRANDDWIDGSDEEPWSFVTYTRNLIAKLKGEN